MGRIPMLVYGLTMQGFHVARFMLTGRFMGRRQGQSETAICLRLCSLIVLLRFLAALALLTW